MSRDLVHRDIRVAASSIEVKQHSSSIGVLACSVMPVKTNLHNTQNKSESESAVKVSAKICPNKISENVKSKKFSLS